MAAIALILVAAVGGALFADFGDQDEDDEAPFVKLEASAQPQSLTISHENGNTLQADETRVLVKTKSTEYEKYLDQFAEKPANLDRISSGDSFTTFDGSPFSGDVEVTVVDDPSNTVLLQETLTVNPRLLVNITDIYTNSPVFADASDLTVEYNITNEEAPESQNVDLVLDDKKAAEATHDIPLNGSVNGSLTTSLSGTELHNGLSLELQADDGLARDILAGPNFVVSIDDVTLRLSAGSPVADVDYTVENTGDIGDTQDIEVEALAENGTSLGTASNEHRIYDAPNSSQLTIPVEPNGDIILTSNDTEDQQPVGESEFEVEITDVNGPVNETEDLVVNYSVENTGLADEQGIQFLVDGQEIDTEHFSLSSNESDGGSFTYSTDRQDPPSVTAEVASEDDTASTDVTILAAEYAVNITSAPVDINETKTFAVDYKVENVADAPGDQTIEFFVNGSSEGSYSPIRLNPNDTNTGTFTYTTKRSEAGANLTVNVTSADDYDTEKVRVLEDPQYEVNITNIPDDVEENEPFTLDYNVTNTGEQPGKQDIDLGVNTSATAVATDSGVTLDPKNSTTGTLSYETESSDLPGLTVTVSSDNTSDTAEIEVLKNPTLNVSITDVPDSVDMNDPLTVEYNVTNTGEQTADPGAVDVEFYADFGLVDTDAPELDPGETKTKTFTYTTDRNDPREVPLRVKSNTSDTASVDVVAPDTLIASLSNESVSEGDTVTVELDVVGVSSQPEIAGYDLTVEWDDSVLELDDMTNRFGKSPFQKETPPTSPSGEAQVVDVGLNQQPPLEPMYTLNFTAVGTGTSDITFSTAGTTGVINNKTDNYETLFQNGGVEVVGSGTTSTSASAPGQNASAAEARS